MQLPKLSLYSDGGSAPIDFVLITLPTSLLVLPLLGLFGICQEKVAAIHVQYELARFASLADVTESEVNDYRLHISKNSVLSKHDQDGLCFFESKMVFERQISLWPNPIELEVSGKANCEKN